MTTQIIQFNRKCFRKWLRQQTSRRNVTREPLDLFLQEQGATEVRCTDSTCRWNMVGVYTPRWAIAFMALFRRERQTTAYCALSALQQTYSRRRRR